MAEPRRRLRLATIAVLVTIVSAPLGAAIADQGGGAAKPSDKASTAARYAGTTSQGHRVSFTVRKGSVRRPTFLVVHRGCGTEVNFLGRSKIGRDRRFSFGGPPGHYFKGRFVSRKKVRGWAGIEVSDTSCPGRGLHTVSYTALRR
jgi:hypothetical protein